MEKLLVEIIIPEGVNSSIDIGANDGALFSNTYKFAKIMHGFCVVPPPNACKNTN